MAVRRLICPQCRAVVNVTAEPGSDVRCGKCKGLMRVPQDDPMLGRTIGGFRILRRIGRGGMGTVYLAEQLSLHRQVALKHLRPGRRPDAEAIERLRREAISAARINHPNIVQVHDIVDIEGRPYIIMEYVNGVSLRAVLKERSPMPVEQALEIIRQVFTALSRAHRERVVHCDIKPENVLIDRDGLVKVADFGLASMVDVGAAQGLPYGSPAYMSPEHARREPLDERADIYATGATLYEMLTGRPPHVGSGAREVLKSVREGVVVPPHELMPGVPAALSEIVMKMLAYSPGDRYASADEALQAITAFEERAVSADAAGDAFQNLQWQDTFAHAAVSTEGEGYVSSRLATRRRSAVPLIIGILSVLTLAAGALIIYVRSASKPKPDVGGPKVVQQPRVDLKALDAAYEKAAAFADEHPDQYETILQNFNAIAAHAAGTKYEKLIAERIGQVKDGREREAEDRFRILSQGAERYAGQGRFAAAERLFSDFPERLRTGEWPERIRKAADDYYDRGAKYAEALGDEARAARESGDVAKAREAYRKMRNIGYAVLRSQADAALAEINGEVKRQQEEWDRQAREQLPAIVRRLAARAAKHEYGPAIDEAGLLAVAPRYRALQKELEAEKAALVRARDLYEGIERTLRENPGMPFRVNGIPGKVAEYKNGEITIDTRAGRRSQPLAEIPTRQLVDTASKSLSMDNAEDVMRIAAYYIYAGEYRDAGRYLEMARKLGADTAPAEARIRILEGGSAAAGQENPPPN